MNAVLDTNTVVSGLIWTGAPRRVLDAASAGALTLFTSPGLLEELDEVVRRPKFARRLQELGTTADDVLARYRDVIRVVQPAAVAPAVAADPDDDAVLACAVAAGADAIVSGDRHLLDLGSYQGIRIVSAAQLAGELPPAPPAGANGP